MLPWHKDPPLGGMVVAATQGKDVPPAKGAPKEPTNVVLPEDNFFRPQLVDSTYQEALTLKVGPSGDPDGDNLCFKVDKLPQGMCLFLDEMSLAMRVRLIDKNKNPPPTSANVSAMPAFPTCMWRSAGLKLNSIDVTGGDSGAWPLRHHVASALNQTASGQLRDRVFGGVGKMEGFSYDDVTTQQHDDVQELLLDQVVGQIPREGNLLDVPPEGLETDGQPGAGGDAAAAEGTTATEARLSSVEAKLAEQWRYIVRLVEKVNAKADAAEMHGADIVRHYSVKGGLAYAKLPLDMGRSELPLVSGVDMTLSLVRAEPKFVVLTREPDAEEKGYRLQVVSIQLLVPVRRYSPGLANHLEARLEREGALHYNFPRLHIKKFTVPVGVQQWSTEECKDGARIPERALVLVMPEDQWVGKYDQVPTASRSHEGGRYSLCDVFFSVNSTPLRALGDLHDTTDNREFMRVAFRQLNETLVGPSSKVPHGINLTPESFAEGNFCWAQDFTRPRRGHDQTVLHESLEGSLRLDLRFKEGTNKILNVFLLEEYPARVTVHQDRRVVYHWVDKV